MAEPFIGQIMLCPYSFAPQNWADCMGQLLPITQYAALFSLIGTTYGGDGRTNFALPDLRGRVAVSQGRQPSGSVYLMGDTGGAEQVQLSAGQMPTHTHAAMADAGNALMTSPSGNALTKAHALTQGGAFHAPPADTTLLPQTVTSSGGNAPHNDMQPFLALRYIIALQGVFPARP